MVVVVHVVSFTSCNSAWFIAVLIFFLLDIFKLNDTYSRMKCALVVACFIT